MIGTRHRWTVLAFSLALTFSLVGVAEAQFGNSVIEGQLRSYSKGQILGVRIRLSLRNAHRLVAETFTRPDGRFTFTQLSAGEYVVETLETEDFEASSTSVSVQPLPQTAVMIVPVLVELRARANPNASARGVIKADVDLNVPKDASKHYHNGMKALESGNSERALDELRSAIKIYPEYYAARLVLAKELVAKNKLLEAEEILLPLKQIAPKQAEPRIQYGFVLLGLRRVAEAISELQAAVLLDDTNWAAHFFLGWAQMSTDASAAEENLKRAIKLNEQKAARAHLYLAKIANAKGDKKDTINHLKAYLTLVPNAPDAPEIRKTVERLSGK